MSVEGTKFLLHEKVIQNRGVWSHSRSKVKLSVKENSTGEKKKEEEENSLCNSLKSSLSSSCFSIFHSFLMQTTARNRQRSSAKLPVKKESGLFLVQTAKVSPVWLVFAFLGFFSYCHCWNSFPSPGSFFTQPQQYLLSRWKGIVSLSTIPSTFSDQLCSSVIYIKGKAEVTPL